MALRKTDVLGWVGVAFIILIGIILLYFGFKILEKLLFNNCLILLPNYVEKDTGNMIELLGIMITLFIAGLSVFGFLSIKYIQKTIINDDFIDEILNAIKQKAGEKPKEQKANNPIEDINPMEGA